MALRLIVPGENALQYLISQSRYGKRHDQIRLFTIRNVTLFAGVLHQGLCLIEIAGQL
jgi:hypothetical protein